MGQKVSPIGLRLGINKDWEAKWYANNSEFSDYLQKDLKTFNVNNKDVVIVKTKDGVLMDNITIKSDDTCVLEYHMNKDEAADLGIENGDEVEIC